MTGEFLISVLSNQPHLRDQVLLIMRQSLPRYEILRSGRLNLNVDIPFIDSAQQLDILICTFKQVFKEADEDILKLAG